SRTPHRQVLLAGRRARGPLIIRASCTHMTNRPETLTIRRNLHRKHRLRAFGHSPAHAWRHGRPRTADTSDSKKSHARYGTILGVPEAIRRAGSIESRSC